MFQDDYIEQQGARWIRPEETLKRDPKDSESHKASTQKKNQDERIKHILRDYSRRLAKDESTKRNSGRSSKKIFI